MDATGRDYPPGDLRVSDAERDQALSELSEAFEAGRISADEFDQRSGQVLGARTGKELTAVLADLPLNRAPATRTTVLKPAQRVLAARITTGASAVTAVSLAAVSLTTALSKSPTPNPARRELARQILAHMGLSLPNQLPPARASTGSAQ
jgi:hypothetical protein